MYRKKDFLYKNRDGEQTMGNMLGKIQAYWTNRAEGYSQTNREELAGAQKEKWLAVLKEGFPKREPSGIKVLDMGTGPGFFAIILARAGYQVTAVDCTSDPQALRLPRTDVQHAYN